MSDADLFMGFLGYALISDNQNSCLTTIGIPGFEAVGKRSKLLKRKEIGWLPISR
jgi:hypothetical protein